MHTAHTHDQSVQLQPAALVFIFMTRRTQAMYVAMLTRLHERSAELYEVDLEPRIITTDFEKGAINAFQEVVPHVTVSGCHFHISQSVLRKVRVR